ncbi:MAG: protein-L-isoaspartate(D-aspartate) O-methyltransferase [Bacteroidales bacterium]|nr:protein-L-isoaspartate(D-aspartate) O-methyltransferase [Bacteroidales bacterium]MBO7648250.1 protein-L-isoaspartate(D-aspartate) O-methyltransferase [Bacteroidales bacterium]MCR4857885.1 protein-L-isoaspartate(D-aspartate) O-methyltransferase [Bacteroidales bacterium]
MTDNYLLLGAKKRLIEELRQKGITDENVLQAFDKVERHRFLESFLWDKAYDDIAIKLLNGQTISHPSTVAFQSQLLKIKKGLSVLEIGTGSGFQAAILSAMGAHVYSIERQEILYKRTSKLLAELDDRIVTCFGDGYKGLPRFAPFDRVIVTCGAPNVPDALVRQLKVGGIMVIPVGDESHTMKRFTKIDENNLQEEVFGNFLFVPMLKNEARQ